MTNCSFHSFRFYLSILFGSLVFLCPCFILQADVWSVSIQNDIVLGTDETYTNGLSFNWMSDPLDKNDRERIENVYVGLVYNSLSFLPLIDIESDHLSVGFKLAQDIYTPSDTSKKERIKDDIPYVGHLYTKHALYEWRENETREAYIRIGVVGPSSGAEWVQKTFHRLIGNDEPQGWDNQLEDQLTLGLGYSHSINAWHSAYENGLHGDLIPSYGFEVGNFLRGVYSGLIFRFGENYPRQKVPAFGIGDSGSNARLAVHSNGSPYGWSVNIGMNANAIFYYLALDSSDQHDVERKTSVATGMVGFSLYWQTIEISFAIQAINMQINDTTHSFGWGGLSLAMNQ